MEQHFRAFCQFLRNYSSAFILLFFFYGAFAQKLDTIVFEDIPSIGNLSISNITCIEHDHAGRLWVSTLQGLYMYDGYGMKKYQVDENADHGLLREEVFRIHRSDDGDVWFVGAVSIYRYDEKRDQLERMTEAKRANFTELYKIGYFDMEDIDADHKLLATKQGYWIYHVPSRRMVQYDSLVSDLDIDPFSTNAHIAVIEKDTENTDKYWMLTKDGLYAFDRSTWNSVKVDEPDFIDFENMNNRGFSMAVDQDYVYILLNYLNVYAYNKSTGKWTTIQQYRTGRKQHIRNLISYKNGIIIVYIAAGMKYYDPELGEIQDIALLNSGADKVESFSYVGIDHTGRFSYIYKIQQLVKSVKPFFKKQFTPSIFTKNTLVESQVFLDTTGSIDEIQLKAYQRNIAFDVGISNRGFYGKEVLFYKMNPRDDWLPIPGNTIELMQLSSGHHEVFVKAEIGNEALETSVKRFYIKPYFYETWWFYLLASFSILAISGLILFLLYLRKLDRKKYELQLIELEMDALRSQMNPHFIFNSLSSIKNYVVSKSKDEAADYLTKFSRLIRMILENSKKKLLTLEDEMKMLELYIQMEQRRLNYSFDYIIEVPDNMDWNMRIAPMLIQPFIENSIWHGLVHKEGEKQLTLQFTVIDEHIELSIIDNGVGREASRELQQDSSINKNSLGLKITESRFESINKAYKLDATVEVIDRKDDQGQAIGTEVRLRFPKIKHTPI